MAEERIPKGTNFLGSRETFEERKYYRDEILPYRRTADFWYQNLTNHLLYGRINDVGDSVYPVESYLTRLNTNEDNIYVFNFVAMAFSDLQEHFKKLAATNTVKPGSLITDLLPKRGWENINRLYHKHFLDIYEGFNGSFIRKRKNKIETFEDFIAVFDEFSNIVAPKYPLTKTAFAKSRFCSPLSTGLCVEIGAKNHSKDEPKVVEYIEDVNFDCYVTAAKSHGFLIDRNAPWRLVADINSDVMKGYMRIAGLPSLFEKNADGRYMHYLTHRIDFQSLQIYLLQFYNSFVLSNPILKKRYYDKIERKDKIKIVMRQTMSESDFYKDYGIDSGKDLIFRIYASLLQKDIRVEDHLEAITEHRSEAAYGRRSSKYRFSLPNKFEMEKYIKNAMAIHKKLDINAAIDYIYLKVTKTREVHAGLANIKYGFRA